MQKTAICRRDISSPSTATTRSFTPSTFTPDGILDYGEGDVKGREAIIKVISGMPNNRVSKGPNAEALRPSAPPSGRSSWCPTQP